MFITKKDPAKIKYAFTPKSEGGLGYLEVCEYLNNHCKCKIKIPAIDKIDERGRKSRWQRKEGAIEWLHAVR